MSMLNFSTLLGPSALVTKEFKTETNPSDGLYVRIVGRKAGLIAWVLTLIGIDTTTVFEVYADKLVYRNSSLSGQMITIFPMNSICTTSSGFFKPILYIILGCVFAFMGLISLIGAFTDTSMLVSAFFFLVLAIIFITLYYFRKVLLISVRNTGAAIAAIAFKRSVIEGIEIKEENAIHVVEIINFLVLAQARKS